MKFSVSRETLYLIFIDRLALLVKEYRRKTDFNGDIMVSQIIKNKKLFHVKQI